MSTTMRALMFLAGLLLSAGAVSAQVPPPVWDLEALKKAAVAPEWGAPQTIGPVTLTEVTYQGEPLLGKPTRVFAWYARPEGKGPHPAVVLVHGGGGSAFRDWALHHAKRGYCAIAMDLSGNGKDGKRLPLGGPDQADDTKFKDFTPDTLRDMWTYHAVANVMRGHTLLAGLPEVDAKRVGITGISWGGYLTCIVAGVDHRLKAAAPVYGCGFLQADSCWKAARFDAVSAERRDRWVKNFDPSSHMAGTQCPILFLNGTNDFAYPMDSYQDSYNLVRSPRTVSVRVRLPHGHIWTFGEVDVFLDSHLKGGKPLARMDPALVQEKAASATFHSATPITKGWLHYARAEGPWQQREWKSAPATVDGGKVVAELPELRPLVFELALVDERGVEVTTPHVVLPAAKAKPAP